MKDRPHNMIDMRPVRPPRRHGTTTLYAGLFAVLSILVTIVLLTGCKSMNINSDTIYPGACAYKTRSDRVMPVYKMIANAVIAYKNCGAMGSNATWGKRWTDLVDYAMRYNLPSDDTSGFQGTPIVDVAMSTDQVIVIYCTYRHNRNVQGSSTEGNLFFEIRLVPDFLSDFEVRIRNISPYGSYDIDDLENVVDHIGAVYRRALERDVNMDQILRGEAS